MEVNHGADTFNETVLYEIRRILSIIKQKPEAALPEKEKENHGDVYEVAYRQAEKDFFEAHKQMNALEDTNGICTGATGSCRPGKPAEAPVPTTPKGSMTLSTRRSGSISPGSAASARRTPESGLQPECRSV